MSGLAGTRRIVRYNWPTYVWAAATCAGLGWLARLRRLRSVRRLAGLGIALTAYWTLASLVVSYVVYDRSRLTHWRRWVPDMLGLAPRRVLNVHVGVEEIGSALDEVFPGSRVEHLEVFDPAIMRSGSLRRARALSAGSARHADWRALPYPTGSWDAVLLVFAAHEVRDPAARHALFTEVRRVLRPGGRLLLVEHLRDLANCVAYGPGWLHFLPRRAWHEVAAATGLRVLVERNITPFVTAFVLERSAR